MATKPTRSRMPSRATTQGPDAYVSEQIGIPSDRHAGVRNRCAREVAHQNTQSAAVTQNEGSRT